MLTYNYYCNRLLCFSGVLFHMPNVSIMDIHVTVCVMCFVVVLLPCGLAANEIINLIMPTLIIIPGIHCYNALHSTGLIIAEIVRRFIWNFFRVEYAHVLDTHQPKK